MQKNQLIFYKPLPPSLAEKTAESPSQNGGHDQKLLQKKGMVLLSFVL